MKSSTPSSVGYNIERQDLIKQAKDAQKNKIADKISTFKNINELCGKIENFDDNIKSQIFKYLAHPVKQNDLHAKIITTLKDYEDKDVEHGLNLTNALMTVKSIYESSTDNPINTADVNRIVGLKLRETLISDPSKFQDNNVKDNIGEIMENYFQ